MQAHLPPFDCIRPENGEEEEAPTHSSTTEVVYPLTAPKNVNKMSPLMCSVVSLSLLPLSLFSLQINAGQMGEADEW